MRKKFTMLLASLFLVMGSAWAKTVTVVNTDRWYQFCCTSNDAVHGNGADVWLADEGTAFAGKSNAPTFFKFISASEGKYHLYSLASEKYVNVEEGKVVHGETASTEWTIGTINEEGYVYISNSDKNYLNNAGGTNNIQIKNHPAGVQSGNPCSLWYMHEFTPLNSVITELDALSNNAVYGLQCERAPLKSGATSLTHTFTNNGLIAGNVNDPEEQFAILRTANTTEGAYYLYSISAQKFVKTDRTYSETPVASLTITDNNGYNNDYRWRLFLGGVKVNINASGIVMNSGASADQGNQFKIVVAAYTDLSDAVAAIEELESRITIEAANGSATDSWNTSTWTKVTENIPAGVTAAEAEGYNDATSNIWSASEEIALPAGSLRATLAFGNGSNRLDILGVELLNQDGTAVVSSDYHFGFSGNQKVNNAYDLEIPEAGVYTIRYWVTFCKENNTSTGNITLQHYKLGIPVYSAAELSNEKVYAVTPSNNGNDNTGAWDVNEGETMLSLTKYTSGVDATKKSQQFAFLNVNEEFYLYSYGAEKFVAKDGNGQKLTEELSAACLVTFDASTITDKKIYPLCVRVSGWHLCATPSGWYAGNGGIVTNWNDTGDAGNAVAIVPVDGTVDLSAAIAKIEAYQTVELKKALMAVLDEANTLAGKSYINSEALNTAITEAQGVYDDATATYAQVAEKKNALSAAIIAAGYVTQAEQFSNNAVYTFLSKRSATAYMMYDERTPNYVASPYMKTDLTEVGSNEPNCQWAVYKSAKGYYYMYNLGAGQFMGTESAGNTSIPFSETPQTTGLKFGVSTVSTHPIMISSNNGSGVVNHSNDAFSGKNKAGVITWDGGFGYKDDPGNVHQVAIVGELNEETLATIKTAVEAYEARGIAKQELDEYLAYFKGAYYDAWASTAYKWRDQEGVNNYTIGYDNALTLEEYYNAAKTVADNAESTAEAFTEALNVLEGVESWLVINQPEVGKFYRLRCVDGTKYLQSTIQAEGSNKDRLTLSGNKGAEAAFLYDGQGLLSYTAGLYMDHRVFNAVGTPSAVIFSEAVNGNKGQYNILVGPNYIYGAGTTLDSGVGTPDNRSGYNWWLEEVTTLPVTVGAAGWGTFYTPVAVTIPTSVKAYTITVVDEKATLNPVEGIVPEGTGLILEGEGTHNFAIATEDAAEGFNKGLLKGAAAKTYVTAAPNTTYYVLAKPEGAADVALYKAKLDKNGGTAFLNGANKVYLPVTTAQGAPAMFAFTRGDEEDTTGIESVEANEELVIFDLAGRRVEKMEKGIYIVNGKKVVIK